MAKVLLGIFFLLLGMLFLVLTVLFFIVSHAFETSSDKVGQAPATLKDTKHKKNVVIYGRKHIMRGLIDATHIMVMYGRKCIMRGSIEATHIKDATKALYTYTVNGKEYRIRYTHYYTTPRQLSRISSVFYVKRFPKIAYLKGDFETYGLRARILLLWAFGSTAIGAILLWK